MSIGFGYQMFMIAVTVTLLNPQTADRWMSKPVQAELVGFLRWSVPVGLLGLILTRSLLTAFA